MMITGYIVMCAAAIAACFVPMAGLPIGLVGAALYIAGSAEGSR